MEDKHASRSDYPYTITLPVTFRDLDVLGHVNNAVYFTWFETARVPYVLELFGLDSLDRLAVIVAQATCQFKAPGFWGETVLIGCGVSRIGRSSFDLAYQVETTTGRLLAVGSTAQVYYDYEGGHSQPLPQSFRDRVARRQGQWQPPPLS